MNVHMLSGGDGWDCGEASARMTNVKNVLRCSGHAKPFQAIRREMIKWFTNR